LLIYQDHKKLTAILFEVNQAGYSFQIQVAETEGRGELVSGNIDSHGKITVQERTPSIATCPICLAAGTLIDTPRGTVPVEDCAWERWRGQWTRWEARGAAGRPPGEDRRACQPTGGPRGVG